MKEKININGVEYYATPVAEGELPTGVTVKVDGVIYQLGDPVVTTAAEPAAANTKGTIEKISVNGIVYDIADVEAVQAEAQRAQRAEGKLRDELQHLSGVADGLGTELSGIAGSVNTLRQKVDGTTSAFGTFIARPDREDVAITYSNIAGSAGLFSIPAATTEKAGVMSAEQVKTLQAHSDNLAELNTTILNYNRKIGNYSPVDKATVVANLGTAVERGMIVTYYTANGWKNIRYVSSQATAEAFANVNNWEDVDKDINDSINHLKSNTAQYNSLFVATMEDSVDILVEKVHEEGVPAESHIVTIPAATTESAGVMSAEDKKLNNLIPFVNFISNNYYQVDNYIWEGPLSQNVVYVPGFYRPNGDFVESSHQTAIVSVNAGDLLRLNINYSNYANAAIITLWLDDTFVAAPLTSEMYSSLRGEFCISVPYGVNKLTLTNGSIKIAKEKENTADIVINGLDIESGNLIDFSKVYPNYGIGHVGDINIPQTNWYLTVVQVEPNTTYYIEANSYRANSVGSLGYSNTDIFKNGDKINFVDMSTLQDERGYKVFTTDDNTNYLYINQKPTGTENNVTIKKNIDDLDYPTTVGERKLRELLNTNKDYKTGFEDKKIAIFGDSITWQAIGSSPNRGWVKYFNEILQFGELVNYARSGATWSNTENTVYNITENTGSLSDNNVIYNQFNRLLNDVSSGAKVPDYIVIAAGTNDAWYPNARPNALAKTAKEVFEDEATNYLNDVDINQCTSIAQAFRYVAEMIIANLPTTKVVICTPLQSTAFTAERNNSVTEVISSCANYVSWNVIVQSKECGVSRLEEKRGYKNTYDGTHTSEVGAKIIGTYLANRLSALYRLNL